MSFKKKASVQGDGALYPYETDAQEVSEKEPLEYTQRAHGELLVLEIGHPPSLRHYLAVGLDRRPDTLQVWVDQLAEGKDLGDGWREIPAPHFRAYGIPGRYIASLPASLAKITREARAVSVGTRCVELDLPLSHGKSLFALLAKNGMIAEFLKIRRYVIFYKESRQQ